MWRVDTHTCSDMITTMKSINTSIALQLSFGLVLFIYYLCLVRTLTIYALSTFPVYDTVLLTIVTMGCVSATELTYLITERNIFPFSPSASPWYPLICSMFPWVWLFFLRFHIEVIPCTICLWFISCTLSQMAGLSSLLGLKNIPLCVCVDIHTHT